jgi:hypothetical protein
MHLSSDLCDDLSAKVNDSNTVQHHWPETLARTINTTGQQHWPPPLVSTPGRHHWPGYLATRSKHVCDDDDGDDDDDDDDDDC